MTEDRDDTKLLMFRTDRAPACMTPGRPSGDLPPIFITSGDLRRLRSVLFTTRGKADDAVLRFLARELDRAAICRPDTVPPDVVTMNARVLFRRHSGQPLESRTLVYDDAHTVLGGTVSILTPLGVALLGLRAGDMMPYESRDGMRRVLIVETVAYQPERAGRVLDGAYRYWPKSHRDDDDAEGRTPGQGGQDRSVVPLRPRPKPRPAGPDKDDDPGPNRAA